MIEGSEAGAAEAAAALDIAMDAAPRDSSAAEEARAFLRETELSHFQKSTLEAKLNLSHPPFRPFAPNWGRVRLKWGKALYWTGAKGGARKQFDIAAHLDLSPADATTLRHVSHTVGHCDE